MTKNGFIYCAIISFLVLFALIGSVIAEGVVVESVGELNINQSSMNATPASPISMADGSSKTVVFDADTYGVAAPADNYTWEIGKYVKKNLPQAKYTHTFTKPGDYTVVLQADNYSWPTGAEDKKYLPNNYLVTIPIEGDFTSTATGVPFQQELNYTYVSGKFRGIPTNWKWEFYNATGKFDTKNTTVPKFPYSFPVNESDKIYTVTVTASNASTYVVDNFSSHPVTVPSVPLISANFTYTPEPCPAFPVDVQFKDNSTGFLKVDAQYWDFGDKTNTSQMNPTHSYNSPGSYLVNYTAINNTYTFQKSSLVTITITGLYANFTYESNQPPGGFFDKQGSQVNFTSTSEGVPTNFLWDFGDKEKPDSSIHLIFANHTYIKQNTYNVSLTVYRSCGEQTISSTMIKPVSILESLAANYNYYPKSGKYPLPVQFYDNSSDAPVQWSWWIYDTDEETLLNFSDKQNPSWVFKKPGTYYAKLEVVNNRNQQSSTPKWPVVLYDGISADFTADNTTGIFPFFVNFTDKSQPEGMADHWNWDFGDGKPGSTGQNTNHTFERKGNWTVTLTASNSETSDTNAKPAYIKVGTKITPEFTPNKNVAVRAPFIVNFTDASTPKDEVSGWEWTFNDGSREQGRTVSHQFPGPGEYPVTMNVSSLYDNRTVTHVINVTEVMEPTADFVMSPLLVDAGEVVSFEDRSLGPGPKTYSWDFGDGGVSTEKDPKYTYQYAGRYYPSLTVTNPYGNNTKKSTIPVSVRGPVFPSFRTDKPDWWSVINQPVTFIDTSKGQPVTWIWDFADGTAPSTVTDPQIVHTYNRVGVYNVTMTATNWVGDTKTAFHSFEVTDKDVPRDVNFEATGKKYSGNHPFTVQFEDLTPSQSNVTEWYWDFGDRKNEFYTTPKAPSHTYTVPGEYSVTLTVRNDIGVNEKKRVAYVIVL